MAGMRQGILSPASPPIHVKRIWPQREKGKGSCKRTYPSSHGTTHTKTNLMNNYSYIIACTLALATVSCENTLPDAMTPEAETVIIANIGSAASRTAIDPTNYYGGHVGILWTPEDAIGVFGGTTANARFACNATQPTGRAAFSGNCATPEYAYYPYSDDNNGASPTSLAGQLPASQAYNSATGIITGDYKYGHRREGAEGEFDFNHLFALFRFNINATGTVLSGESMKSVTLTLPQERQLAGDFTFDINTGTYRFTGNTSNTVTMLWTDTPALNAGSTYTAYMSVAPDLHTDDPVTITVATDKHTATFTRHIAYDLAPNQAYTFNLRLSDFQDDMTVEEVTDEPVEKEETANCYMINTTGEHSFLATQIGNGDKGIIPGAGFHVTTSKINPQSAKVLWQDTEGFINESSVRLDSNGRVYYTAAKNTGNALIAVYAETGCKGNILWSWHIWGVGDTMPQDEEVTNQAQATFMVMDRALGAPSTASGTAMLYQWGRNIPIPNSTAYYVNGTLTDIEKSYPVFANETLTIQDGVQNPDKLLNCTANGNNSDWMAEENEKLWGDSNKDDQYTWYSDGKYSNAAAGAGWTDQKTIYDPSPVGYRVANKFTFTGFVKNTTGTTPSGNATVKLGSINYVKYDNGWYFKRNANDTAGSYYPMTGSRGATTGSLWVGGNAPYITLDYTGSYWTSACQKNARQSHQFSLAPYSTESSTTYNSKNAVNTVDFAYRANAFAVRCVRDGVE